MQGNNLVFTLLVATLSIGASLNAYAADRYELTSCNFGASANNSATVVENRLVYADGERIRFDRRADRVECTDVDGDALDEIVAYSRSGAYTVHGMTKARAAKKSLSKVCKKVRSLTRGEIYKSVASNHIHDQRKLSSSFITMRSTTAPKNNCLYVYDKKGNLIHKLGRYFPSGALYSSRYYGGHGCGDLKSAASVAATARKNTGSSAGYMTSGTGNCVLIPNMGSCFNSSAC